MITMQYDCIDSEGIERQYTDRIQLDIVTVTHMLMRLYTAGIHFHKMGRRFELIDRNERSTDVLGHFAVSEDRKELDCILYELSVDERQRITELLSPYAKSHTQMKPYPSFVTEPNKSKVQYPVKATGVQQYSSAHQTV